MYHFSPIAIIVIKFLLHKKVKNIIKEINFYPMDIMIFLKVSELMLVHVVVTTG